MRGQCQSEILPTSFHFRLYLILLEQESQGFFPVGEPEFLRPGSDLRTQNMELRLAVDV